MFINLVLFLNIHVYINIRNVYSIVCESYKVGEKIKKCQKEVDDDSRSGRPLTNQIYENVLT